MTEKGKEGPVTSDGRYVFVFGKEVYKDNTSQEAEAFSSVLNDALSPLVERAGMASVLAEALRDCMGYVENGLKPGWVKALSEYDAISRKGEGG